eukprot:TRINITY_DN87_c0_g1_i1.p3 TRINITY_DN87_c0_g1~~TRINITY_DN87_c0_g1_i1.p3  ORF type:complete len:137 (-),score=9.71 TRINITY_DN87_c0_g1_i1:362-772(-)
MMRVSTVILVTLLLLIGVVVAGRASTSASTSVSVSLGKRPYTTVVKKPMKPVYKKEEPTPSHKPKIVIVKEQDPKPSPIIETSPASLEIAPLPLPEPCTDVPPDSEYTCAEQALYGRCSAPVILEGDYCKESCDRC